MNYYNHPPTHTNKIRTMIPTQYTFELTCRYHGDGSI